MFKKRKAIKEIKETKKLFEQISEILKPKLDANEFRKSILEALEDV
jgi:hypothetical protein